jgi:hypothetical protein
MLLNLLGGRALPAGELALAANVTPQTASGHLRKLSEARLIQMESQGRHRYYRLAGAEVADALEALLVLLPGSKKQTTTTRPHAGTLAYARTCYSHLAGWLGVRIADALQANDFISQRDDKAFVVTDAGRRWFETIGIPVAMRSAGAASRDARQCLDWTERRPHLAGKLGVALYRRLLDLGWLSPISHTRTVRVTLRGKEELWKQLRVACG